MKGHLILISLLLLAACGKEVKKKTTNYSLSELQASGVYFISTPNNGVSIACTNTGATNQQRLTQLQSLSGSIGLNNSNTQSYTLGNSQMTVSQASMLLQQAISRLQYSSLTSQYCPAYVLGQV